MTRLQRLSFGAFLAGLALLGVGAALDRIDVFQWPAYGVAVLTGVLLTRSAR
jgi:hypothetical protein